MIDENELFEARFCMHGSCVVAASSGGFALIFTAADGIGAGFLFIAFGALYAGLAVMWQRRADSIFARALAVALAEGEMPELRQAA